MNRETANRIVQNFGYILQCDSLMETIEEMDKLFYVDQLSPEYKLAYLIVTGELEPATV